MYLIIMFADLCIVASWSHSKITPLENKSTGQAVVLKLHLKQCYIEVMELPLHAINSKSIVH